MSNYYRKLLEGYTCIKMKYLSIEQACKLTQPVTYSSKILKIQSINHKSNWTSGGGTYQGAIPPKNSNKDGLSKEIENREQEQKELGLEKVFCVSRERERSGWTETTWRTTGGSHPGQARPRAGRATRGCAGLVGPLGQSRCPSAPFFEEKI